MMIILVTCIMIGMHTLRYTLLPPYGVFYLIIDAPPCTQYTAHSRTTISEAANGMYSFVLLTDGNYYFHIYMFLANSSRQCGEGSGL